jgi:hypothetical protein
VSEFQVVREMDLVGCNNNELLEAMWRYNSLPVLSPHTTNLEAVCWVGLSLS